MMTNVTPAHFVGESWEQVTQMLEELNIICEMYGMRINKKKTKTIITGGKEERSHRKLEGDEIENSFKYLGSYSAEDVLYS